MAEIKTFNGLAVSSKFAICGLPIRLDSYKTCSFGCGYCFSNGRKIMEFEKVLQVANVASIAKRLKRIFVDNEVDKSNFLDTLISKNITWHCGGMSDPFQPIENELHVTKKLVDLTKQYGITILFSTKADTFYDCKMDPNLHTFQLSVTNVHDRRDIEPNVPLIKDRIRFFNELKESGFKVGIRVQPFIPKISDMDIFETFKNADHFTIEGIKVVPQNKEQKEFIKNLGLPMDDFTQMGLLNLKPHIRKSLYKPIIEWMEENHKSYSISDNDLRSLSNSKCCCGDALVKNATDFNTTAMIMDYGTDYALENVMDRVCELGCQDCVCKSLFTSNRTNGCSTVQEFYKERFHKKSSPFSPEFQNK